MGKFSLFAKGSWYGCQQQRPGVLGTLESSSIYRTGLGIVGAPQIPARRLCLVGIGSSESLQVRCYAHEGLLRSL
jgi:hypothetical protein